MRALLALPALALSFVLLAAPAAASSYAVDQVWVQTPDGSAWTEGSPVVLVVRATSPAGLAFPDSALSVVMQTDGERTKCLNVAMKRVSSDGTSATYAGIFYPFRAAAYDGKFGIGDERSDIRFTVGAPVAAPLPIAPDAGLPVLGPVRFNDYAPAIDPRLAALAAAAAASLAIVGVTARRRIRTSFA